MNDQTDRKSDCSSGKAFDTGDESAASPSAKIHSKVEPDAPFQVQERGSRRRRTSRRVVPVDKMRRTYQGTLVDYIGRVGELLPGTVADGRSGTDARKLFAEHPPRRNVWIGDDARTVVCYLFGNSANPAFAIRLSFPTPASADAISLLRT